MKKRGTIYKKILFLISLILLLFSSAASAATAESISPKITETQITTSGLADNPDVYDDRIVWQDDRNGNRDIYMYDLSTKKETQITTNTSGKWDPAIYSDRIVWTDDRDGNYDIYMYDLSTKKETQISNYEFGI